MTTVHPSTTEPTTRPGLDIGPIRVEPPVVLAPMAGVTTAPYRTLCRRFGNRMSTLDRSAPPGAADHAAGGLYVNQMITARALIEGHRRMLQAAEFAPGETPRSIQLYGTDPYWIGEAVRRLVDGALRAGSHEIVWNGRDDRGRPSSSGVYSVLVHHEGAPLSRSLVLVR